ncbi:MAG: glycine-rich domain-containing protein [Patescibacteria group bacterium]
MQKIPGSNYGTGGVEYTILDGGINYTIHVFTTNGTLNITSQIENASVLVIAGGGSGSAGECAVSSYGGAGGAGGYRYFENYTIPEGNYSVTVGLGGARGPTIPCGYYSNKGQNSVFWNITSTGGGGGEYQSCGWSGCADGGSGGGQQGTGPAPYTQPGAGTLGQGWNGGNGSAGNQAGGGGGAGGNGSTCTRGNGINNSINGSVVLYAQGGYGCNGGVVDGINGTGGGGGQGSGSIWEGGAGGSGIVIVRYVTTPSTHPSLNCTFSSNVTKISFKPFFGVNNTASLVYPVNQTDPGGVLTCTNNGTASGTVQAKLNDTYDFVDEVASCDYFSTQAVLLNSSLKDICSITVNSTKNISLYRNYTNKTGMVVKNVAVNISVR